MLNSGVNVNVVKQICYLEWSSTDAAKEMLPAVNLMSGDDATLNCITQHGDFIAMVNATVLEQVGPLFRDKKWTIISSERNSNKKRVRNQY